MTGRTIQQYELLEKLGAGGMGEIYKARDQRLNRFVAIKVLPAAMSGDAVRRLRFMQEAQAASALNHPNIIVIYDILTEQDTQYMVAEFIDGKTLLELIPKDGLRAPLAIQYAWQMADALCAAHGAGIIHRDLKPANVMVSGTGLVKLLDFGLAKSLEQETAATDGTATATMAPGLTVEGTLLGTVNYMSPEQAEARKLDARSDIFSFGAVLYEMLTGRSAFQRSSMVATLSAILRDDAPRVSELAPDVPGDLEQVVTRCLQKDPDRRFQSMQEVRGVLTALKRQSDSGALYNRAAMAPIPPVRKRSMAPAILGVVIVAAAAGGGFWWMTHRPAPAPRVETKTEAPAPVHDPTLTDDSIITMVAAKVDPSVIIGQIRSTQTNFDMTEPAVIGLSKAGVPANVIEAMRNPQAAVVPTPSSSGGNAAQIVVKDGLLVRLTLTDDIPATAEEGAALNFKVAEDVRVSGALVIRKGASASGSVVDGAKKKFIGLGGKMTFRLDSVDAADGQKLSIRATQSPPKSGTSKRSVEGGKSKDVASSAGTEYAAYVDGAQPIARR